MTLNTSYASLYSLGDIPLIGGTDYTLVFDCTDQYGTAVTLAGATIRCKIAPFGTSYAVIDKAGSITATSTFTVYLTERDTSSLSGKYTFQPQITFANGSKIIPAQGTLTIAGGL